MQEACLLNEGTMLTVIGLEEERLEQMCRRVQTSDGGGGGGGGGEVCVANFMFARGCAISGSVHAVETVGNMAEENGASVKKISVSGAFHSPLMEPAVPKLRSVLDTIQINSPKIPVYSNVTGRPYTSVEEIRECLALAVTHPVHWDTVIRSMTQDNPGVQFCEVGPGRQLKAMLRRIDQTAYKQCVNIEA